MKKIIKQYLIYESLINGHTRDSVLNNGGHFEPKSRPRNDKKTKKSS